MNFVLRSAREGDADQLLSVARQFSLLNLPADSSMLEHKIEKSIRSFNGELDKSHAKYLFVVEDLEEKRIAGSSQIIAKHGNPGHPAFSFEVLKKERFSKDLGVGFIHQILRLKISEATNHFRQGPHILIKHLKGILNDDISCQTYKCPQAK